MSFSVAESAGRRHGGDACSLFRVNVRSRMVIGGGGIIVSLGVLQKALRTIVSGLSPVVICMSLKEFGSRGGC